MLPDIYNTHEYPSLWACYSLTFASTQVKKKSFSNTNLSISPNLSTCSNSENSQTKELKMRAKSSSPKSKSKGLDKQKQPHLSSAYIRSLVKQLASSRTKNSTSSSSNASPDVEEMSINPKLTGNLCDERSEHRKEVNSQESPQQHKKQVRRRLHNTRPYQQKLLNMAEARKEIVTALKSHRASMKQCSENQPLDASSHQIPPEQNSWRNPSIFASTSSNPSFPANNLEHFSYSQGFRSPHLWPVTPIVSPSLFFQENFSFPLPSQTLGLNLNLEDFTYNYNINSSSVYSSSFFPNISCHAETPFTMEPMPVADSSGFGLQHGDEKVDDYDVDSPFDEEAKFPTWLSVNGNLLDDHCSEYYVQDSSLSSMKIEEIEGMDGDWLI